MTNQISLRQWLKQELALLDSAHELEWILDFIRDKDLGEIESKLLADQIVLKKKNKEPLGYILGSWAFRDFEFEVGPGVLIPRPETEELVDLAKNFLSKFSSEKNQLTIADLGAGTGCIGLSLALELNPEDLGFESIEIFLVENSSEARIYLENNHRRLQDRIPRKNQVHIEFMSWLDFSPLKKIDLVCSNPPYVSWQEYANLDKSVKNFEPQSALVSADKTRDPLAFEVYKSLFHFCKRHLSDSGAVIFELGSAQEEWIIQESQKHSLFSKAQLIKDMSSKNRFFQGSRH